MKCAAKPTGRRSLFNTNLIKISAQGENENYWTRNFRKADLSNLF